MNANQIFSKKYLNENVWILIIIFIYQVKIIMASSYYDTTIKPNLSSSFHALANSNEFASHQPSKVNN